MKLTERFLYNPIVMHTVLKTKTKAKPIEIQKQNNSAYIHNSGYGVIRKSYQVSQYISFRKM